MLLAYYDINLTISWEIVEERKNSLVLDDLHFLLFYQNFCDLLSI